MSKPATTIKILDVLRPEHITLDLKSTAKNDVIAGLADSLFAKESMEVRSEVLNALLEREKLGSTGIGSGVAVPHAKSARTDIIACALGIAKKGLDFEALDGEPAYLVFLLVAPPNSQSEHLNILARIVRLLKDRVFRQALREATTCEAVVRLISEEDS